MSDAAVSYAERDVCVFPLWWVVNGRCACGKVNCANAGKHPIGAVVPSGVKDATINAAVIRPWWARYPHANIATPTSWCTVLDVDPRHGGDETLAELERRHGPLPETAEVLTGGGGRHIYFRPVPGLAPSTGKVGTGLDVKSGPGAYVLLPPSSHASSGTYRDEIMHPLFETPLAEMPAWLLALASGPAPDSSNGHRRHADEWADKLIGAPEGQRRVVALEIAGHYLGLRIAAEEVEAILLSYAARCMPPFPERECREIVRDLARRDRAMGRSEVPAVSGTPVLVCLADVAAEDVEWVWLDRIARGKLALIIGEPGEGKSYVTHDVAARLTRGLPWPDGQRAPTGAVVILTCEDGIADTVRPRIERQGGDAALVFMLRAVRVEGQECPFNFERDLAALEQALMQTRAIALVVDPISAYLGAKDSYKDAEIRGLLAPLAALAEKYRVAIIAILHLTKAAQRKVLLRAQGSIAFVAQARTVLAVAEHRDVPGRRLLVSPKNNYGEKAPALAFRIGESGLTWDEGIVQGTAETLLAVDEPETRSDRRERDDAVTFLRQLLRDGPASSKQAMADAKANGISQRTLWRAKSELGIEAERATTQGGKAAWFWMPPSSAERRTRER